MKPKILLFALFILSALLLSACNINFITEFNNDGSGSYTQEIGLSDDQLASFGMSSDEFCDEMAEDMPDGMSMRKETRNEKETWCIFKSQFASIDALKELYSETDTRINQIAIVDDKLIYDVVLDMSDDDAGAMGITINASWTVKMPGKVIEHNATEQNGNTLTWKLAVGRENDIRAVSEIGSGLSIDLGGNWITNIVGGVLFLCLCCFVPLVIAGVAFFLIRKKKAAVSSEPVV
jgi:hypothetical protein